MKLNNFNQAYNYLIEHLPSSTKSKYPGDFGLKRTKYFLSLIGNPQEKMKIIHLAGTSGKGSTACMISNLLHCHGFKVGLSVSPHLIDIRERFQINNGLITKNEFVDYLNRLIPYILMMTKSKYGIPSYFEMLVFLSFYIFHDKKVDYAVIETGMGGLYDATNVVKNTNKLSVITKIGFDHTKVLGNSITKIAHQKAMIMNQNAVAISLMQLKEAMTEISKVAQQKKAKLITIGEKSNYSIKGPDKQGYSFDFSYDRNTLKRIRLGLLGKHQIENASLALSAFFYLSKRDSFTVFENVIRKTLVSVKFPGRMEKFAINKKVIIADGAHNPQKMYSFISSLKEIYPKNKFDFLIAFKRGKNYLEMLKEIISCAKKIIITDFFTDDEKMPQLSEDPEKIAGILEKLDYEDYKIVKKPSSAFAALTKFQNNILIITGSLYLLSDIYQRKLLTPPDK